MAKEHSQRFVTLVNDARTRVDEITPDELREKIDAEDEEFELLDVREMDEWDDARITGARFLSKGIIEREIENEVPDLEKEIILYCAGGYRSVLAADNLNRMGYHDVKSLKGGFRAWTEAGHPIEKKEA